MRNSSLPVAIQGMPRTNIHILRSIVKWTAIWEFTLNLMRLCCAWERWYSTIKKWGIFWTHWDSCCTDVTCMSNFKPRKRAKNSFMFYQEFIHIYERWFLHFIFRMNPKIRQPPQCRMRDPASHAKVAVHQPPPKLPTSLNLCEN